MPITCWCFFSLCFENVKRYKAATWHITEIAFYLKCLLIAVGHSAWQIFNVKRHYQFIRDYYRDELYFFGHNSKGQFYGQTHTLMIYTHTQHTYHGGKFFMIYRIRNKWARLFVFWIVPTFTQRCEYLVGHSNFIFQGFQLNVWKNVLKLYCKLIPLLGTLKTFCQTW